MTPIVSILAALTGSLFCVSLALLYSLYRKQTQVDILRAKQANMDVLERYNIELKDKLEEYSVYKGAREQLVLENRSLREKSLELEEENRNMMQEQLYMKSSMEVLKSEKEALNREKLEWKEDKENLLKKLSLELLEKNSQIVKANSESTERTTTKLFEELKGILNKVSALDASTKNAQDNVNTIRKALLEPGAAGHLAEVTLENILKASGLMEKAHRDDMGDYIIQTSFGGDGDARMRPDAIIYLPNNNFIVIDSKSSSHFLELQMAMEAGDDEKVQILRTKIKDRMRSHLGDLKSKDYKKAQAEYLMGKNGITNNYTIMIVMFLQTEKMLDILRDIDPTFEAKSYADSIPVITPIGLFNLLNVARYTIQKDQQDKNNAIMQKEMSQLLKNIVSMFTSANDVGRRLRASIDAYDKFANTFNSNIITRARNMSRFGIGPDPCSIQKLDRYEVGKTTIIGAIEDVTAPENAPEKLEDDMNCPPRDDDSDVEMD